MTSNNWSFKEVFAACPGLGVGARSGPRNTARDAFKIHVQTWYTAIQGLPGIWRHAPGVWLTPGIRVRLCGRQEVHLASMFLGDQTWGQVNTAGSRTPGVPSGLAEAHSEVGRCSFLHPRTSPRRWLPSPPAAAPSLACWLSRGVAASEMQPRSGSGSRGAPKCSLT